MSYLSDLTSGPLTVVAVADHHFLTAEDLIVRYGNRKGLRTLDALQLAIALETRKRLGLDAVVASDKCLSEIASYEGLTVINPETS